MASPVNAALCALLATAFWTLVGYALARQLLPRTLAIGAAAVIGWAAHSAVALPVFIWIGLTPISVVATGLLCVLAAGFSLSLPATDGAADPPLSVGILILAGAAAALLALVPAAAILPKIYGEAVQLSDPIFDHAKIAIVDTIARLGLPPVNPVFGAPERLVYYYLWHFSVAEIALAVGASGWEADIGLTGFTAFASLTLTMGLAVWLSKRQAAALWVLALATAGSLWETLYWLVGSDDLRPLLWWPIGMAGWLFQATWAPQHVMAGGCAVTAMLLLARVARDQSPTLILTLALVIVAGFESSTFVGGVTFAIAALIAAPLLFTATPPARRLYVMAALALAAALVVCLIAPFVLDQLTALHARGVGGSPVVISPYTVFRDFPPLPIRRLLDLPAYWLMILPIELPAAFVAGVIGIIVLWRSSLPRAENLAVRLLACLAGAGLVVSWLLVSTVGDNNDLGLRAIIPATMVLIIGAAAAATNSSSRRLRVVAAATAVIGLLFSLPDTAKMVHEDFAGRPRPGGTEFAQSSELWAAVRRYASPAVRVANNPLFLADLTPWPANISWALFANRNSCFAGIELAIGFAPLSAPQREAINAQFVRVFDGQAASDDVHDMATKYGCEIAAVVRSDKAWENDPFAASSDYRLVETREDRWRIYARIAR
jgi:hypothetical protein